MFFCSETRDAWLEEVDESNKDRKKRGEKRSKVKNVEIADFAKEDDELDILSLKRAVLEVYPHSTPIYLYYTSTLPPLYSMLPLLYL